MKKLTPVLVAVSSVAVALSLTAEQPVPKGRDASKAPVRATQPDPSRTVVGTIQYDPGAPADGFAVDDGSGNDIVGNRFSSAAGSPLKSGNLTGVSFFRQVGDGGAVISLMGPPTAGGFATVFQTVAVSGVISGFNAAVVSQAVGPDFLVGMYLGTFNGPDSVGIRNATTNAQGFHAFQINFLGAASATGFTALPATNAMVRATGNILTPVELLEFSVE